MKKLINLLLAILFPITSLGQQSINTAGGQASGPGQMSFSVGQVTYTAIEEPAGANLNQGVQIPFEFYSDGLANDSCDFVLSESPDFLLECGGIVEGTTVGASQTTGLNAACGGFPSSSPNDVWYVFEADGSSDYTITIDSNAATSDSEMDAVLFIYSGVCENLTEIACADENFGAGFTGESITLQAPNTGFHYIRVIDYTAESPFSVSLVCEESCQEPLPAVNEADLSTTLLTNVVVTSWTALIGQIGCQIQVRLAGGSVLGAQIIVGANANSFNIPLSTLQPATDYEWRVRCGCSQVPLIAGPFSTWKSFSTLGEAAISSSPNPTTGSSMVTFSLAQDGYTKLEVYDLNGRFIKAVFIGDAKANNNYSYEFDGSNLPNGIYIYRLTTSNISINNKFVITR
jgi:hypothetical protein